MFLQPVVDSGLMSQEHSDFLTHIHHYGLQLEEFRSSIGEANIFPNAKSAKLNPNCIIDFYYSYSFS